MYALAVMQFRPAKPWVQTLLMATQQQMPAFGAQELSNLLWSLAVLGLRPNTTWLAAFERQVGVWVFHAVMSLSCDVCEVFLPTGLCFASKLK